MFAEDLKRFKWSCSLFHGRAHHFVSSEIRLASGIVRVRTETLWMGADAIDHMVGRFCEEVHAARTGRPLPRAVSIPVILAPWPSSVFIHEAVGHSLEADEFEKLPLSLGECIAMEGFEVIDDPDLGDSTTRFESDAEGNAARKKYLIRDGHIEELLGTNRFVRRFGTSVRGNARASGEGHPLPRMSVTVARGPTRPLNDWMAALGDGVICYGTWGGRGMGRNYIVRPSYARTFKNGRLTGEILRRFEIAGDKFADLARLVGTAGQLEVFLPPYGCAKNGQNDLPIGQGAPYLVFENLQLRPC